MRKFAKSSPGWWARVTPPLGQLRGILTDKATKLGKECVPPRLKYRNCGTDLTLSGFHDLTEIRCGLAPVRHRSAKKCPARTTGQ
jgi:hypothetical protein